MERLLPALGARVGEPAIGIGQEGLAVLIHAAERPAPVARRPGCTEDGVEAEEAEGQDGKQCYGNQ